MTSSYGDVDITPLFSQFKLPTGVRLMLDTYISKDDDIGVWVLLNGEPKGEVLCVVMDGTETWTVSSAATFFMKYVECMDFEGGVNYLRNTLGF